MIAIIVDKIMDLWNKVMDVIAHGKESVRRSTWEKQKWEGIKLWDELRKQRCETVLDDTPSHVVIDTHTGKRIYFEAYTKHNIVCFHVFSVKIGATT